MHVSIGNAYPASQISKESLPERQLSSRLANQVGHIEKFAQRLTRQLARRVAQRMSGRAVRWLASRRAWSPRVTAPSVSSQGRLKAELEGVRREMLARTGVDVCVGAARSRGVARTASRMAGSAGVLAVEAGQERAFLAPLPLCRLDGVSDATFRILKASGLVTIGELQRVPKAALQAEFGQVEGLRLWRAARGEDSELSAGSCAEVAAEPSAEAELRLLSGSLGGSLGAAWRGSLFAGWRQTSPSWLRRVRLAAGAPR